MRPRFYPICTSCRHFDRAYLGGYRCAAFPVAIPETILSGRHDHHLPIAGDGGTVYTPADDADPDVIKAIQKRRTKEDKDVRPDG